MTKKVWYGFLMCVILAWISFIPFLMYKEDKLNMSFIKAEQLISQGQEAYEARDIDSALFYVELADAEYPRFYYPKLLKGNWLWEAGLELEAVIAYHNAIQDSYHIPLAYDRIIEFYQSQGMLEQAARYQEVYNHVIGEIPFYD